MTKLRDDRPALRPPPRAAVPAAAARASSSTHRERSGMVPAVVLFAGLAVAGVGVFVVLPKWVARQARPGAQAAQPAPAATPAPTAAPRETAAAAPAIPDPTPRAPRSEARQTAAAPAPAAPPPGEAEWARGVSDGLAALERGAY